MMGNDMIKNNLAGAIVLYNPDLTVLDNVASYAGSLNHLYVLDNSEFPNQKLVALICNLNNNISYHSFKENLGIAKALNIASGFALTSGYKWLLTMDQDSFFEKGSMERFIFDLNTVNNKIPNLGILTPYHEVQTINAVNNQASKGIFKVKTCMTSGNMINLHFWASSGGFIEKLFIDYVDHEYCLKIRKLGSVVYQTNNVVLKHYLGDAKSFKFIGQRTASHHNYIRRYYITRNRLYTIQKYFFFDPETCLLGLYSFFAEVFKLILVEEDKVKKLKSIIKGIMDFINGRYGKYSY
jgi:rhamnosyltransferase